MDRFRRSGGWRPLLSKASATAVVAAFQRSHGNSGNFCAWARYCHPKRRLNTEERRLKSASAVERQSSLELDEEARGGGHQHERIEQPRNLTGCRVDSRRAEANVLLVQHVDPFREERQPAAGPIE